MKVEVHVKVVVEVVQVVVEEVLERWAHGRWEKKCGYSEDGVRT